MNRRAVSLFSWLVLNALALSAEGLPEELRLGTEFQVHSYTTGPQAAPSVAAGVDGDFVVVWQSYEQDGSHYGVFGRRFSKAGAPLATEFQVPAYVTSVQSQPRVAAQASGDYVVVWQSFGQDGSSSGIFARRFSSGGELPRRRVPGQQQHVLTPVDSLHRGGCRWRLRGGLAGQRRRRHHGSSLLLVGCSAGWRVLGEHLPGGGLDPRGSRSGRR